MWGTERGGVGPCHPPSGTLHLPAEEQDERIPRTQPGCEA